MFLFTKAMCLKNKHKCPYFIISSDFHTFTLTFRNIVISIDTLVRHNNSVICITDLEEYIHASLVKKLQNA